MLHSIFSIVLANRKYERIGLGFVRTSGTSPTNLDSTGVYLSHLLILYLESPLYAHVLMALPGLVVPLEGGRSWA